MAAQRVADRGGELAVLGARPRRARVGGAGAPAPRQVRLDAAASRLLLSVAEVLFQKAREAANSKKPGDSQVIRKNMVKLRRLAQLAF